MKSIRLYFDGGLGDVIKRYYIYDFPRIARDYDRITIVLASHNPFAHELFTYHPHNEKFILHHAMHHYINLYKSGFRESVLEEEILSIYDYRVSTFEPCVPIDEHSLSHDYDFSWAPDIHPPLQGNILIFPYGGLPYKCFSWDLLDSVARKLESFPYNYAIMGREYPKLMSEKRFKETHARTLSVPATLFAIQRARAIISSHSFAAQAAGFMRKPLLVLHCGIPDFVAPSRGTGHTFFLQNGVSIDRSWITDPSFTTFEAERDINTLLSFKN